MFLKTPAHSRAASGAGHDKQLHATVKGAPRSVPRHVQRPGPLRSGPITAPPSAPTAAPPSAAAISIAALDPLNSGDQNVHGTSGAVVLDALRSGKATTPRRLVFVASESAPWSKTGGLGDVIGSLPAALAARGHRVMVVTPKYADYPGLKRMGQAKAHPEADVGFYWKQERGVDWVFVDHPSYPRPGGIYADAAGVYGDNQFRYSLLCLAALEAPLHLDLPHPPQMLDDKQLASLEKSTATAAADKAGGASSSGAEVWTQLPKSKYGQEIVFIANDWHASLVPVYLAGKFRPHGVYGQARSILAIHNLRHQGVYPPYTYDSLALPGQWYGALEWQYPPHQRQGSYAEEGRSVNHMKAGISCADRIVTVSAGYAEEIKTYMGGWGMEGLLLQRDPVLNGIVNGIDLDEWDPAQDPHTPMKYDATNFVEGKRACKLALQRELGLPEDEHIPLFAFIGRLDPQKGADILLEAAAKLLPHEKMQLVCLGSGAPELENGLRWLEGSFKGKARGWVGFNVPFSHRLTAAADMLLMPSRFEPCGLNQIYAMRYGTVPIAHRTGGLKDTVLDFNPWTQTGTGWTYEDCSPAGLQQAISTALRTYWNHKDDWHKMQKRGMERECSWDNAAQQYEQLFDWSLTDPPYCRD